MKTNFTRKAILTGVAVLTLGSVSFAQTVPGAAVNVAKGSNTVKVVDNKGTIKYFQSNNGITQITNTTTDKTTTTWQLGGTLTENTYIDASGAIFALDGLTLETQGAAISDGAGGVAATGYTLLVRDEATGATRKMLATDLIQSGYATQIAPTDDSNVAVAVIGVPADPGKVFVFRNGAKLLNADYTIATDLVTVNYASGDVLPIYAGDIIEVQFIK
jgi:hypothetical protein